MSAQDPGACSGNQVYPPAPKRCTCAHLKAVHAIVDGERRTCSTSGCGCRAYREPGEGS